LWVNPTPNSLWFRPQGSSESTPTAPLAHGISSGCAFYPNRPMVLVSG